MARMYSFNTDCLSQEVMPNSQGAAPNGEGAAQGRPAEPAQKESSGTNVFLSPNWPESFSVPWETMPKALLTAVQGGKRPVPKDRRKMIRIIIDSVLKVCPCPLRKQLAVIAMKVVDAYPASFKDAFDGTLIGTGYDSVLNQLVARAENMKREESQSRNCNQRQSQKRSSFISRTFTTPPGDPEELRQKQLALQAMFKEDPSYRNDVSVLMESTYYLQQEDIKAGLAIPELKITWPFLCTACGIQGHLKSILNIDLKETLERSLTEKKCTIMNFFNKGRHGKKVVMKVWEVLQAQHNKTEHVELLGVIQLITSWFGEDLSELVQKREVCFCDSQHKSNTNYPAR